MGKEKSIVYVIFTCLMPLCLLFAGCGTSTHVVSSEVRDPVPSSQVRIFERNDPLPEEYEVVARISTKTLFYRDDDKLITDGVRKAAELGANGIVLQDVKSPSVISMIFFHIFTSKKGYLTAIYSDSL